MKQYIPKLKPVFKECDRCGAGHATWWKSTPPPSCGEQKRRAA